MASKKKHLRLILIGITMFLTGVISDCTTEETSFQARTTSGSNLTESIALWDNTTTSEYVRNNDIDFSTYFYWNDTSNWSDCKPGTCTINILNTHGSDCASMLGVNDDCTELISLIKQNNNYLRYNMYYRQKDSNSTNLVYSLTYTVTCSSRYGGITSRTSS